MGSVSASKSIDSLYVSKYSQGPQRMLQSWHQRTTPEPLHKHARTAIHEKSNVYLPESLHVRLARIMVSNVAHAVPKSLGGLEGLCSPLFPVRNRVLWTTSACLRREANEYLPVSSRSLDFFSLILAFFARRLLSKHPMEDRKVYLEHALSSICVFRC